MASGSSTVRTPDSVKIHLLLAPFELGVLPTQLGSRIDLDNLLKLAQFVHTQSDTNYLSFIAWSKWACDILQLTPDLCWMYFETFDLVHGTPSVQRIKHFKKEQACTTKEDLLKLRAGVSVNSHEFMLFLYLQQFGRTSLKSRVVTDEWVSPEIARRKSEELDLSCAYRLQAHESARLTFFSRNLPELLQLLVEPEAVQVRNDEAAVPLQSLSALHFLVRIGSPELTTFPTLLLKPEHARLAGFSKLSQTFQLSKLTAWLREHLTATPGSPLSTGTEDEVRSYINDHPSAPTIFRVNKRTVKWDGSLEYLDAQTNILNCKFSTLYLLPFKYPPLPKYTFAPLSK